MKKITETTENYFDGNGKLVKQIKTTIEENTEKDIKEIPYTPCEPFYPFTIYPYNPITYLDKTSLEDYIYGDSENNYGEYK